MNGIVILAELSSAACGMQYPLNETITVIAYDGGSDGFWSNSCGSYAIDDIKRELEGQEPWLPKKVPDCSPIVCSTGEIHATCDGKGISLNVSKNICSVKKAGPFKDVPWNHPARKAIEYVKLEGAFKGYKDKTFRPDASITRAELITVLFRGRVEGGTICGWDKMKLSDVERGSWYGKAVCLAKELDVVKGYSDGTFHPHQSVSLAEAAKIIVRNQYSYTGPSYDSGERDAIAIGLPWWTPYFDRLEQFLPVASLGKDPNAPITREGIARILHAFWEAGH